MPGGDKTGPMGQGSRTGRRKGFCSGNKQPGYTDEDNRCGAGRRFGQRDNARGPGHGMKGRRGF